MHLYHIRVQLKPVKSHEKSTSAEVFRRISCLVYPAYEDFVLRSQQRNLEEVAQILILHNSMGFLLGAVDLYMLLTLFADILTSAPANKRALTQSGLSDKQAKCNGVKPSELQ